jgi:hypothetical protein
VAGTIHRTMQVFNEAIQGLGITVPLREIERISIMINKAMSSSARSFHTTSHIFNLIEDHKPLQVFAALFHDVVYFHIDNGFIPEIEKILMPYINIKDGVVSLKTKLPKDDKAIAMNCLIFDKKAGDVLDPFSGLNEFLSSLLMTKELELYLEPRDIVKIAASIEATIPFRKKEENGEGPATRLFEKLKNVCTTYQFNAPEEDIISCIQQSVLFANKDVENFAEEEVADFLDNTWKLLPETNPSLRTRNVYTIKNYRIALQKMEGFMNHLDPNVIFEQFQGVPSEGEYNHLFENARRNVLAAREYLGVKLLATSILEAVADISGGDAPIAIFMGDIGDKESLEKFQSLLPKHKKLKGITMENNLQALFAEGRNSKSDFDLKYSPLANYFYAHVEAKECLLYKNAAREYLNGKISAKAFLDSMDDELIIPVIEACGVLAFTRAAEIQKYLEKRKSK